MEAVSRWVEHRLASRAVAASHREGYGAAAFQAELGDAGFLVPRFSGYVTNEFGQQVPWIDNSFGFRMRREIERHRPPGVLRVLMLGDSFVAGHRLGQDQTVGYQMERWLQHRGFSHAEVLIAAIEEPVTGLDYLERFGVRFEPQVVMLGITLGNDLAQVYSALAGEHGRYRFAAKEVGCDHELEFNPKEDHVAQLAFLRQPRLPEDARTGPGPGLPPSQTAPSPYLGGPHTLFGSHFLGLLRAAWRSRGSLNAPQAVTSYWNEYRDPALFDGNGIDICLSPPPPEIERTYQLLFRVLAGYQRVCACHGARFIVMLHAERYQVQAPDLAATIRAYALNPARFDWMEPNRRICAFCAQRSIPCFDPTAAMAREYAQNAKTLFMPYGDMHWNAAGARAFFAAIRPELEDELTRNPIAGINPIAAGAGAN